MKIHFRKYEACGNDFLFIPNIYCERKIIRKICDRHYGVGADGVVISDIDNFVYFNKDGSEASICGNGLRCFALNKYLYEQKVEGTISTNRGEYFYKIDEIKKNVVEVQMEIPTYIEKKFESKELLSGFEKLWVVDAGVQHIVLYPRQGCNVDVEIVGEYFNNLKEFKDGVNVDVVEFRDKVFCYTYERGCGRTLSCGSGALATFKVLNDMGEIEDECEIFFENGSSILFRKEEEFIRMIGKARYVAEGEYIYE